jgi:MFS family permease
MRHMNLSGPRGRIKPLAQQETTDKLGFFTSLVHPDYRRLWIATGCAQSASWALIILRAALVYNLTQSNAWVGFVTMAAHLPSLVVTPFAGFLADRLDRRRVLAATYSLNLAHNAILALLVLSGHVTAWQILGLAVLNGCFRATEMPTNQALLPNLVPPSRLLNAVALNQLMQQGARMLGPLLLLPVIHFIGHETAFFVSTGLYAIGWTQVVRIRTVSRGTVEVARGIFFNLAAGIGYIYTHPMVFAIMILTVLHCALTMAFESVLPYFSRNILGMTTGGDLFKGPTYLMIGIGAGGMVGNLVLARVQSGKLRGQLFLWVGLASGLAPMVFGLTTTVSQAMLAATILGASTAAFMTLSHGMIQALAPDGIRGRVMSANTWHAQGTMAGFNAINGVLMDMPWMTVPLLLSSTGFIFVAIVGGSLLVAHLRAIYAQGIPAMVHAR